MGVVRFNGTKLDPAQIAALVGGTLVNGSKPSAWWARQSTDFRDKFMDTIRTSMRNGESLTQAITRVTGGTIDGVTVPGILKTTKGRAGALTATAQNAVANEAALKTYQANNDVIKAVMQVSTLDNRTSDICIAYSGQVWDVNSLKPVTQLGSTLPFNGGPPRHFNCRSRLRPVTKSFRELGIDADEVPTGTRASMDGQVPADITFNQFLKGKSTSFQDRLLGSKRAQLWRDDKINLTQLVDMRGNPMSISQLEQKLGIQTVTGGAKKQAQATIGDDFFARGNVPGYGEKIFLKEAQMDRDDVLVFLDRKTFEKAWKDSDTYIPPDLSKNTIGNRIKGFEEFLDEEPIIKTGHVSITDDGIMGFTDGRHRSRVLLNTDMERVPVTMSRESAENLSKNYGIRLAQRQPASQAEIERIAVLQREAQKARVAKFKADREARRAKKAAEEAEAARKAKKAADKAKKAALQRERDEKAARLRAERKAAREKAAADKARKAEKEAKRQARADFEKELKRRTASKDPDDMLTLNTAEGATAEEVQAEILRFARANGYTRAQVEEFLPLDLMPKTNPTIARHILQQLEEKIARAAKSVADIEAATAALPEVIPTFKSSREAMEWTNKFLINKKNNPVQGRLAERGPRSKRKWNRKTGEYDVTTFDEIVAWGNYDKAFFRVIAEVTAQVSKRFNMKLPNFIGVKGRHPTMRFKAGNELAAVEMQSDSLLLPTTITNKKKLLQRANNQEGHNALGFEVTEKSKRQLATMLDDAKALKESGEEYADELIAAIEDAISKKDFPFSATSIRGAAFDALPDAQKQAMYIWDTIIHESGHRLHSQFKAQVDEVLIQLFGRTGRGGYAPSKNRYLWQRQVSEYATTNSHEFLAESFTRYMMGDHVRIYPPLLKLFKQLDNATDFGIEDLSFVFKEFGT